VPAALATVLVVLAVGAVALAASSNLKLPLDPWFGLSDDQRQAQIQTVYDQQADFIRAFNASGQDPRSLHRELSQSYDAGKAGPDSLSEALAAGETVVLATVRSLVFEPIPGQWLGHARVSLDVIRSLKGQAGPTLELIQSGSPAPTADGLGVLQELDSAPILMPGDRVLLVLVTTPSGGRTPMAGAGIVYLEAGKARALDSSPLQGQLAELSESEVLELYLNLLSEPK
jgi:hypothetical protein